MGPELHTFSDLFIEDVQPVFNVMYDYANAFLCLSVMTEPIQYLFVFSCYEQVFSTWKV